MKTEIKSLNIFHAVGGSLIAHLLFLYSLPILPAKIIPQQNKKFEKVRLKVIEKEKPVEKIEKKPVRKKLVQKKTVRPIVMKRNFRVAALSSLKPLPVNSHKIIKPHIPQLPEKQFQSKNNSSHTIRKRNVQPVLLNKAGIKTDSISPYATKVVSSNPIQNHSFSKLGPQNINFSEKNFNISSQGIAKKHNSRRVLLASFNPVSRPVKSFPEDVKENGSSLTGEDFAATWGRYTNSIQVKIAKAKTYPILAKERKQQGKAFLSFKLSREGKVFELRVETSSGHEILDRAALKAIKEAEPYPRIPDELSKNYAFLKIPISFVLR